MSRVELSRHFDDDEIRPRINADQRRFFDQRQSALIRG
jgi:hypothetical protein